MNDYWRPWRGRMVLTTGAKQYKRAVALKAMAERQPMLHEGDVSVTMTWTRKHKRGDLDNLLKCLLDSLKGCAYTDDAQVAHISASRFTYPEIAASSITVEVRPA